MCVDYIYIYTRHYIQVNLSYLLAYNSCFVLFRYCVIFLALVLIPVIIMENFCRATDNYMAVCYSK